MKHSLFLLLSACSVLGVWAQDIQSSPVIDEPTIVEKGANHRVWQTITREETPDGGERFSTNAYTELSPGIYYFEDNEWKESREEIVVQDGVAVALKGQNTVIFSPNSNDPEGAIDFTGPDGTLGGRNYLAAGSPHRNAGITGIEPPPI